MGEWGNEKLYPPLIMCLYRRTLSFEFEMPPTPEGVSNWWTGSSALPLWDPTKGKASLEAMETMSLTELFQPPKVQLCFSLFCRLDT